MEETVDGAKICAIFYSKAFDHRKDHIYNILYSEMNFQHIEIIYVY